MPNALLPTLSENRPASRCFAGNCARLLLRLRWFGIATLLAPVVTFAGCTGHTNQTGVVPASAQPSLEAGAQQAHSDASRVLDSLHEQAARANYEGYFALYAPDAVFLGTDRTEYWPLEAFQRYAKPHFDAGRGWTYTPIQRELHFHNNTAWFEETLHSESYGKVRGTGVLVRLEGQWKVAQYNLTLPIPNDLFGSVAQQIKAFYKET